MQKLLTKLFFSICFILCMSMSSIGHAESSVSPIYDFSYKLVAIDAQSKGQVTSSTTQVELGVLIENHSQNIIDDKASVGFNFTEGDLHNGRGLVLQKLETNNGLVLGKLKNIGRSFVFANVKPTLLSKGLSNDVVLAGLTITATVKSNGSFSVVSQKEVEDIVYTSSNNDLIPLLLASNQSKKQ